MKTKINAKKLWMYTAGVSLGMIVIAVTVSYTVGDAEVQNASAQGTVTEDRCIEVQEWFEAGVLTSDHPESYPDAEACAVEFPLIWAGAYLKEVEEQQAVQEALRESAPAEVTESRCKTIKGWFDAGTLTSNHPEAQIEAEICSQSFPSVWNKEAGTTPKTTKKDTNPAEQDVVEVTKDQCRDIKLWFDQDVLTDEHEEFENAAELCVAQFPALWAGEESVPEAALEDTVIENYAGYKNPFPDTELLELEGSAAAELYRRQVISGYKDGEFKGDRPVNRAEAAKFLLAAANENVDQSLKNAGRFGDVFEDQWYIPYIMTAAKLNVINGYPDGKFKPGESVNTVEFLVMLAKMFSIDEEYSNTYSDIKEGQWYVKYVGLAAHFELFPKRTDKIEPGAKLSRNEVAVALYQYLKNRD